MNPFRLIKCNISTYKCLCTTINVHLCSASYTHMITGLTYQLSILSPPIIIGHYYQLYIVKLGDIFNIDFLRQVSTQKTLLKISVGNTLATHFTYLHSNLAYQLRDKNSLQLINVLQQLCKYTTLLTLEIHF